MKKVKAITAILGIIVASTVIYAQSFWGGKTMSSRDVKAKWGREKYDVQKFKEGSYDLKAKMAYWIMSDKSLIGRPYEEIREMFGENDGFYFIDTYPTYIIQRGKNHSEETWQLVFRMDNQFKVRDIIMHKNCCEK
ncbi:MAG: hypothetical protein ACK5Y2_01350 [Bdellovibrionales bacterium]